MERESDESTDANTAGVENDKNKKDRQEKKNIFMARHTSVLSHVTNRKSSITDEKIKGAKTCGLFECLKKKEY